MTRVLAHRHGGVELELPVTTDNQGAPPEPPGDEYCHIEMSNDHAYCGHKLSNTAPTCQLYAGEAICPSCGLPTCPRCAVLSSLAERLIPEEEAS